MDVFNNMKSMLLLFVLQFFIAGVFDESVSVKEGESVTLHSGLTGIETDDVIQWRFGPQGTLTAQINRAANKSITFDDVLEGRFRGRLKLDNQTGALTIRNIRTEHSGLYEVTSSKHSLNKIFNVSVVPVDDVKSVSVLVGDSVTLHTDLTEIQRDDEIQWRFGHQNSPIAEIDRKARKVSTYDGPDGRFRHNLQLDYLTGSLTIKNIGIRHSGLYEVDISTSSSKHTIHKSFIVMVSGEIKSETVKEGESVTLRTGFTEVQIYDSMTWMFGDTVLAVINKGAQLYDDDERFRDKLQLDNQTGSLTITKCTISNSGLYELKILSNRQNVHQRFNVTLSVPGSSDKTAWIVSTILLVFGAAAACVIYCICLKRKVNHITANTSKEGPLSRQDKENGTLDALFPKGDGIKSVSVMEEESVTLNTDAELQTGDEVLWMFGDKDTVIAKTKGGTRETTTSNGPDGRFRNRLKLDHQTGSLTITNTKTEHTGEYKLKITRSGNVSLKLFSVTLSNE
ncbi:uncharacterized protein LOC127988143 isoform X2 [Carassius gibelio]|uniref:uncharacterized protein LOC127988143 isoform X2 n=1 Tax=Carassius gibelio TaxID=101364 RepID=UPI0022791214|nr:uncharacterized protein LOC127988143 isoform X2 [Carassius gibelio]